MSHSIDGAATRLSPAQARLASCIQEVARDRGMTPGAALAAFRTGYDGGDNSAGFAERWDVSVAELDDLAAAFLAGDGFELIDLPPATMAELAYYLAMALSALPEPLECSWRKYGPARLRVHVYGLDNFEAWRQWLGAPAVKPGEWTPSTLIGDTGMNRRYVTAAEWRGQAIELTVIESRKEPETRSERRERLAAELADLDRQIGRKVAV